MKIITKEALIANLKREEIKQKIKTLRILEGQTIKTPKTAIKILKVIFDRKTQTFKAICSGYKKTQKIKLNASVILQALTKKEQGGKQCAKSLIK